MAGMDGVVKQLKREIYGITCNEQMWFKKEFSIHLIQFDACWQAISIQELQKTIKQPVIHFRYPNMYHERHISESIWGVGSGDKFTTDIPELLHISTVKEADGSTSKANYIRQMLKHSGQCTGLDYLEEKLLNHTLQG